MAVTENAETTELEISEASEGGKEDTDADNAGAILFCAMIVSFGIGFTLFGIGANGSLSVGIALLSFLPTGTIIDRLAKHGWF
jgi:hypothetical protein